MSDEQAKWRSKNGHAIASDVTDKIPKVTPPDTQGALDDENKRLRGTLKYILAQAEANHPQSLIVIAMNAREVLEN